MEGLISAACSHSCTVIRLHAYGALKSATTGTGTLHITTHGQAIKSHQQQAALTAEMFGYVMKINIFVSTVELYKGMQTVGSITRAVQRFWTER